MELTLDTAYIEDHQGYITEFSDIKERDALIQACSERNVDYMLTQGCHMDEYLPYDESAFIRGYIVVFSDWNTYRSIRHEGRV